MDTPLQNKAEETLNSLKNIRRAEPKPFFYTRLMARISSLKESKWEKFSGFIARPRIAFAGISVVVVLNIMAAWSNLRTPVSNDQPNLTTTEEYTQVAATFYDYENMKP